jgi:MFS transporter, OFA family, oxalate/formate antiporter
VLAFRENLVLFVILTGVVFLGWGETFSLFPATLTDIYDLEYVTTNHGSLYVAQGVEAILGESAAYLVAVTGTGAPVFFVVAALDITTALLAYFALRLMRRVGSPHRGTLPPCSRATKTVSGEPDG